MKLINRILNQRDYYVSTHFFGFKYQNKIHENYLFRSSMRKISEETKEDALNIKEPMTPASTFSDLT
jgi:hypothetical protein